MDDTEIVTVRDQASGCTGELRIELEQTGTGLAIKFPSLGQELAVDFFSGELKVLYWNRLALLRDADPSAIIVISGNVKECEAAFARELREAKFGNIPDQANHHLTSYPCCVDTVGAPGIACDHCKADLPKGDRAVKLESGTEVFWYCDLHCAELAGATD